MRPLLKRALLALSLFFWPGPVLCVELFERLSDPVLEARARKLSALVKCPTCQGQCIDDSNAQMAQTLRLFIRQALQNGASDEEILDLLVESFGESVLFEPLWQPHTLALWLSPLIFLALGGGILAYRVVRSQKKA